MKTRNSRVSWITGIGIVVVVAGVLGATLAAPPARAIVGRLIARFKAPTPAAAALPSRPLDVEQRARLAHGWSASIVNSVSRGAIIAYDMSGRATSQYAITIIHSYPDQVRVEVDRGAGPEASGFNNALSWKAGAPNLTDGETRDIRAVARLCPERLFTTRAGGADYREIGQRFEDASLSDTGTDWASHPIKQSSHSQAVYDQVELTDSLGPAPGKGKSGDVRRVSYYVDSSNLLVSTARWLEPDNPAKSIDTAPELTDIRVDFADYRDVNGVKWPFRVTHTTGGRVDFRIVLNEVKLNQQLPDAFFQKP